MIRDHSICQRAKMEKARTQVSNVKLRVSWYEISYQLVGARGCWNGPGGEVGAAEEGLGGFQLLGLC